jgi:hypothetical protein
VNPFFAQGVRRKAPDNREPLTLFLCIAFCYLDPSAQGVEGDLHL